MRSFDGTDRVEDRRLPPWLLRKQLHCQAGLTGSLQNLRFRGPVVQSKGQNDGGRVPFS